MTIEQVLLGLVGFHLVSAILCLLHILLVLLMLWNVVKYERGTERLAWLIIVTIPVIGALAFFILLREERAQRSGATNEEYQKRASEWLKNRPKSLYD